MNFQGVTHPWITPSHARLTWEFFANIQSKRYSAGVVSFLTYPRYILLFFRFLGYYIFSLLSTWRPRHATLQLVSDLLPLGAVILKTCQKLFLVQALKPRRHSPLSSDRLHQGLVLIPPITSHIERWEGSEQLTLMGLRELPKDHPSLSFPSSSTLNPRVFCQHSV